MVQLFLFLLLLFALPKNLQGACQTTSFEFSGLEYIDEPWFRSYLELDAHHDYDDFALEKLRIKILTTDVFSSAQLQRSTHSPCHIEIRVSEKWTLIPVLRGAYGGGTPLLVLGGYETNAFGKMYALGGELRRFGNRPPGAFVYLKSLRAWNGLGMWGGEIWLDRRRRSFYTEEGNHFGYFDSEAFVLKTQLLYPWSLGPLEHFQIGGQAQYSQENPTKFEYLEGYDSHSDATFKSIEWPEEKQKGGILAPMIAYDNLEVDGLLYEGAKFKIARGLSLHGESSGEFSEVELFHYLKFRDLNLAVHGYLGRVARRTPSELFYLGGFDSVRGLPDGIQVGNRILYLNGELRVIGARYRYFHLQPVAFYDVGSAWFDDKDPHAHQESSVGAGLRIAIPQIYRFVFRIDYAKSVGKTKSSGISIGLNQFFQPYKMNF